MGTQIMMLPGKLLCTRDSDTIGKDLGGGIFLHFSDNEHKVSNKFKVHFHTPSDWWEEQGELPLSGRLIFADKWSEETFDWEGHTFSVVDERNVLAVVEEEER